MQTIKDHAFRLSSECPVWIIKDVPERVLAMLRVHSPQEYNPKKGTPVLGAATGNVNYLSKRALLPAAYAVAPGVTTRQPRGFDFTAGDGDFVGQSRPLALTDWPTAVTPAASLVPGGSREHVLDTTPVTNQRVAVYCRLKGTAVVGEVLVAGDGIATKYSGTLASVPVVPGSISLTTTILGPTAVTLTDVYGDGTLVGANVKRGSIDYVTGEIEVEFSAPVVAATNIVVGYEHGALHPLDFELNFLSTATPDPME